MAMPLLTMIFISIGIFGVQLVGVQQFKVDAASFWSQMRSSVGLDDIMEGVIKGCVFGVACSLIAVYEGYNAAPTAGVGRATTRTVVNLGGADADSGLHPDRDHAPEARYATDPHCRIFDRPVRAARLRGAVFPGDADHQPRTFRERQEL